MMKEWKLNIKILAADTWFSKCVRESANWICQRCKSQHEEGTSGLHCAHFMSRGKWSTRFDPSNVAALCYGCHSFLDRNPHEKLKWFEAYLGKRVADAMIEKSEDTRHGLKKLKKEIASHYRAEYKKLLENKGQNGGKTRQFVPF